MRAGSTKRTGRGSPEDRMIDAIDERKAMRRLLTTDERRAYEILISKDNPTDEEIAYARKHFMTSQKTIASMEAMAKLAEAFSSKTSIYKQDKLLPYVLPKGMELSGKDGGPIETRDMSESQLESRLADLLGKAGIGIVTGGAGPEGEEA